MNGTLQSRVSPTFLFSAICSALAALFLLAMVGLLLWQSVPIWGHQETSYLFGKQWFYRDGVFGALPMIYGTIAVSTLALLLAAPVGVGAAIFISECLPSRTRLTIKLLVELLAGIPSVVYGLLGILFLRTWIYDVLAPFDPLSGDTLLTAAVLLAVMILPTTVTLADDALRDVPSVQRLAARGLGLNRTETVLSVVLPQAAPAVLSAVLLALGRALGETVAVFLVIGRQDNQWPANLFSLQPIIGAGQTLTTKLGGAEVNIAYGDPLHWAAMVGLGLILLGITTIVTMSAIGLNRRRMRGA